MKKINLEDIRHILSSSLALEKELSEISDEELVDKRLYEDLGIDSLDRIIFFQKLENKPYLSIMAIDVWNWKTIRDVLDWYEKN